MKKLNFSSEPILLPSNIDDWRPLQKVIFNCSNCSVETIKSIKAYKRSPYCRQCTLQIMSTKVKETCRERYGVTNVFKLNSIKEKSAKTKTEKYNNPHYVNPGKARNTCLEKYGVDAYVKSDSFKEAAKETKIRNFGSVENCYNENIEKSKKTKLELYNDPYYNNRPKAIDTCKQRYNEESYMHTQEFKNRSKESILHRYGVSNVMQSSIIREKARRTCLEKYGVPSYSQTVDFQYKRYKKYFYDGEYFDSSWELALWIYAKDNNLDISRVQDPFVYYYNDTEYMYYPDFKYNGSLIEIKGTQFFENGDTNGKMINPFDRSLDEKFEAKHQCAIDNNVIFFTENDIKPILQYVNNKYTKDYIDLFLVDLPFPYLNSDLSDTSDMGLIHHFHKSIYDATREGKISPREAWEDKNIIKKVALNRLKYKGHCRPSDILQGLNVTRIANKVTVFKPKLAEDLIKKYLNDCDSIFDPFSGFSGRMLGTIRCGKDYFGQDINEDHVRESNEILRYINMQSSNFVVIQDILKSKGHDFGNNTCLFTCPPYGGKEHWAKDKSEIEKSCDEWIDICIEKYKCKKYLFVVDETEKYRDKIVETLTNKSHFGSNNEYVVFIS